MSAVTADETTGISSVLDRPGAVLPGMRDGGGGGAGAGDCGAGAGGGEIEPEELSRPGVLNGRMYGVEELELRKRGRPRASVDGALRDVRIPAVRVSVAEKRACQEEAWMAKRTICEWVRWVLMREIAAVRAERRRGKDAC